MKNKILEHSLRKIKNNYKRFISLICMALLGVGFYSSIQITSPEIIKTLDDYYDRQNVYDIRIDSVLGFDDEDISTILDIDSDLAVYGGYSVDSFVNYKDDKYTVKLFDYNKNINKPYLKRGKYPSNDEIIVEDGMINKNNLKIGDKILIEKYNKEFKIVGSFISPLYMTSTRDNTNLGDGTIDYNIYINSDLIKSNYYSSIYISIPKCRGLITNSDDYKNRVDKIYNKLESIKSDREKLRSISLYGNIVNQKWTISIRDDNVGYNEVIHASESIASIGKVFPLIFYIIAIFIGLISMMRMVEEDRGENGTLKALGFSSFSITMKYVLFSFSATFIGGLVGIILLNKTIPRIIIGTYQKMLFSLPGFSPVFDFKLCLVGFIIGVICIVGSSIFVSVKNNTINPASLMRPKVPKDGKRVFLENIPFIWKKINFSNKITIRNIFRYKSRVFATIFGIVGCTSLLLTGFGLRDSVKGIVGEQYGNVFKYDKLVMLQRFDRNFIDELENNDKVKNVSSINISSINLTKDNIEQKTNLIVPGDDNFNKSIKLRDINNDYHEVSIDDDSIIIISKKLASNLGVGVGDKVTLVKDDVNYKLKVSYIIENYIQQYSYISKNTYEKIIGEYSSNALLLNMKDISNKSSNKFDEMLIEDGSVYSIVNSSDMVDFINNLIKSLDTVILVFIIAAALLAFVVLYNLSNINISERLREIATLKVLGFYNKEVDSYITRENVLLTSIGILIGLFLGKYLCYYLIHTCETDNMIFPIKINLFSYIISTLIAIFFTVVVSIFTHFSLRKIDMIESLKNVE